MNKASINYALFNNPHHAIDYARVMYILGYSFAIGVNGAAIEVAYWR